MDNLQLFIDGEIAKKEEKERLRGDRQATVSTKKKRTWEDDMADQTEVDETEEDFMRFYFVRERVIMERIFGTEWRRHLKHPEWQHRRDQYQIPEVRPSAGSSSPTSSMSDERRSSVIFGMRAKTKGFLNMLSLSPRHAMQSTPEKSEEQAEEPNQNES